MHDPVRFIECVQQNPAIWDKTSLDYMNRIAKDLCWVNIGRIIFANWSEITAEEREQKMKDMKNKWRNMRDGYTKFINQDRSPNSKEKKIKSYIYADLMSFLQDNYPKSSSSKPADLEEDEEEIQIKLEEEEVMLNEDDTFSNNEEDVSSSQSIAPESRQLPSPPLVRRVRKRRNCKVAASVNTPPTVFKNQNEVVLDSDREFLLSILPDYKLLNYQEKLDFRMYTLGFFKRVNLQNSQITSNAHN